jgi:DNA-directed RNA polymerase specialized sigma24 family protein
MTALSFTGWVSRLAQDHTGSLAALASREGLAGADALDAIEEALHTLLGLPQARALGAEREDAEGLMAVLVRAAARARRQRPLRAAPGAPLEDGDETLRHDAPATDAVLAMAEEDVALRGCASRLVALQRTVATLRMLEELALEPAAHSIGLTPAQVAVRLTGPSARCSTT